MSIAMFLHIYPAIAKFKTFKKVSDFISLDELRKAIEIEIRKERSLYGKEIQLVLSNTKRKKTSIRIIKTEKAA